MVENLADATTDNIDEFKGLDQCVAVFHKKLCPHCKILMKVIAKVEAKVPGVTFIAIDSEEEPGLMERYGVERVPTLVCMKNGHGVAKKAGVMNPKEMLSFIGSSY
jgi:thioredoxin 1